MGIVKQTVSDAVANHYTLPESPEAHLMRFDRKAYSGRPLEIEALVVSANVLVPISTPEQRFEMKISANAIKLENVDAELEKLAVFFEWGDGYVDIADSSEEGNEYLGYLAAFTKEANTFLVDYEVAGKRVLAIAGGGVGVIYEYSESNGIYIPVRAFDENAVLQNTSIEKLTFPRKDVSNAA